MRILHVIRDLSPKTGGPVNALIGLNETQQKFGHEVKILSTSYGITKDQIELPKNSIIETCNWNGWRFSFQFKSRLKKLIKWSDVIHIHMLWEYPSLITAMMARKLNKPFLLRPCGALEDRSLKISSWKKNFYLKFFSKSLFNHPCRLHFSSNDEKKNSTRFGMYKSIVVNNGVISKAKENVSKNIFYSSFPFLKNKKIILFLARVHPIKRPEFAILSFCKIFKKFPDTFLVIAGPFEKKYCNELKEIIKKYKIENRVIFTGLLSGDLLYASYKACYLFILPSLQESFGISIVEAMAASKPVVISKNIAIANSIKKADAGIICEDNVEDYSSAVEKLLSSNSLQKDMGNNGKNLQKNFYDWEILSKQLETAYIDQINEYKSNLKI